jgi:hypothetical protein
MQGQLLPGGRPDGKRGESASGGTSRLPEPKEEVVDGVMDQD